MLDLEFLAMIRRAMQLQAFFGIGLVVSVFGIGSKNLRTSEANVTNANPLQTPFAESQPSFKLRMETSCCRVSLWSTMCLPP